MLEQLKSLMHQQVRGQPDEFIYTPTDAQRAAIRLDVRYALRHRTQELPLLVLLGQTVDRSTGRIRFPAEVLARLGHEIDSVRGKLPPQSPLIELADGARRYVHGIAAATAAPAPSAAAPAGGAGSGPGAAPNAEPALSPGEQVQTLKSAAAKVEVNYLTTLELGDATLAGFLNYCLGLGEYEKIIETLVPRAASNPRAWVWSLLVTAMRLADHPDFAATVGHYHAWLEATHPETVLDLSAASEQRKFSMEKIAAIEKRELGGI